MLRLLRKSDGADGVEEEGKLREAWRLALTHHGFHERDGA